MQLLYRQLWQMRDGDFDEGRWIDIIEASKGGGSMAFKAASLIMAPDGDPTQHRASIKTDKLEQTTVLVELFNFD